MKIKFILMLFIVQFSFFLCENVFSYSTPVQDVFIDIDSKYKYLNELQTLYDKGMIVPDINWKFNPRALLRRDEFVWILSEVTCKKCIQPFTAYDLVKKYENKKVFFDVNKTNKYYYCIADSENNLSVNGYDKSTTCDDWTYKLWEKPFCSNNNIILEEALSIILRVSWILTYDEANRIRKDIYDWKITQILSDDVSPKNIDWSVYSFYPDFQKALDYELVEVDAKWKTKSYRLIDVIDWKIRPKKTISKEDFLKMAFVALKANSCINKETNTLPINIIIKDSICKPNNVKCKLTNLNQTNNTYDFTENITSICEWWIKDPEWYIWRFYNSDTWEEYIKNWKYIDNYKFLSNWNRIIFLRVIDSCWDTGEVYSSIYVNAWENLNWSGSWSQENNITDSLSIYSTANPTYWSWPLSVDFNTEVYWGEWPYKYVREFWDGNTWFKNDEKNIYIHEWIYNVVLHVTDKNWKKWFASLVIKVKWINKSLIDSDDDRVMDIDDLCPLIVWSKDNKWCPILEELCSEKKACKEWTYCSKKNVCEPNILNNSCDYRWWNVIFGNTLCNSCPCDYSLDFITWLRKCDIIFPAITSDDNKKIFSRGWFYQIK